jgi:hypothetical protein
LPRYSVFFFGGKPCPSTLFFFGDHLESRRQGLTTYSV